MAVTQPVTKLGLAAPFEGAARAHGYEALYAAKLAVREQNAAGGAAGWLVELVALDVDGQLGLQLRQARALAVDPDVTFAIGVAPAAESATVRAQYAALGLPVEFVDPLSAVDAPVDPNFAARYLALSNGVPPGGLAVRVYQTVTAALAHIAERVRLNGRPMR